MNSNEESDLYSLTWIRLLCGFNKDQNLYKYFRKTSKDMKLQPQGSLS